MSNKNKNESTVLKMKGKMMWPKLFTPDNAFNSTKWTLDLLLDKEGLKVAKENQLKVRKVQFNKKTQETSTPYSDMFDGFDGSYLRITRPTHKASGEAVDPPIVKDSSLRDFPSNVGIGNGSEAYVRFLVKNRDPSVLEEHGGYTGYLLGVQILDLVEYEGSSSSDPDSDFISEDEGFKFEDKENDGGFNWEKGDSPFDPDIMAAG